MHRSARHRRTDTDSTAASLPRRVRLSELIDDYLLAWVVLAVLAGVLAPSLRVVTRASTPILVVMVGSTSLLLSLDDVRRTNCRAVGGVLLAHLAMPLLGFGVARILGLPPATTAGFVLLGAVTPELVSPTMTALADGDIALSSVVLVTTGLVSVVYAPASVTALLGGTVHVGVRRLVTELFVAVVLPMSVAVLTRTRYEGTVSRYDDYYPSIASVTVVLIIGGVAAANADRLRSAGDFLALVTVGVLAVNVLGYALGFGVTRAIGSTVDEQIAGVFAVGMRDFAVAAAVVVAAGFPSAAALPAICFGIVEMATSAGIARLATRR